MAETKSFVVGSQYGARSGRWLVTVDDQDVYVTATPVRKVWKVTLHKSGRWHLKDLRAEADQAAGPLLKSHRDDVPHDAFPVGLVILIPDRCLRRAATPDRTDLVSLPDEWLARPQHDGLVELSLLRWKPGQEVGGIWEQDSTNDWPGKSLGTQLLAAYKFSEDEVLGIFFRSFDACHPRTIAVNDRVAAHLERLAQEGIAPLLLDSPERRGCIFSVNAQGAITIIEYAID